MNHAEVGRKGEELARAHLRRRGWRILETNHRSRLGEVDVICREGATVVFVEVKTRTSDAFGAPAAAVGTRKQNRLRALAQEYLAAGGLDSADIRFDVVAIRLDAKPPAIEHIEGAF